MMKTRLSALYTVIYNHIIANAHSVYVAKMDSEAIPLPANWKPIALNKEQWKNP